MGLSSAFGPSGLVALPLFSFRAGISVAVYWRILVAHGLVGLPATLWLPWRQSGDYEADDTLSVAVAVASARKIPIFLTEVVDQVCGVKAVIKSQSVVFTGL